ncbi:uncharacterized membrane protein At1g16860-like [Telopea speciosissima]|uniref:uncharacterized membrane protein At1g16860-like n=1 Tax=Telopea speciosissima TaxID=54955 RepID=UPI001CC3AA3F|nr:uncharacterized membrane protein At1g16860-like [Telopea speciosissima]
MNDLTEALRERHCYSCKPIPASVFCVLVPLFFLGLTVSIFILVVVHNGFFFAFLLVLSSLVLAFLAWNTLNWRKNSAILLFLDSFPDSDLRTARHGQLVKLTGFASCGSIPLESSYEKVPRCIYTSTLLYEYRGFHLKAASANHKCLQWTLAYSERFSTDFYITDIKSGMSALVKAGYGSKVTPLIVENTLVNTTDGHNILSSYLKKWLAERNLSTEARLLHLKEGYIKEGSYVTVMGVLHRDNNIVMILQPHQIISTGCHWRKLLLPVDFDGLILRVLRTTSCLTN